MVDHLSADGRVRHRRSAAYEQTAWASDPRQTGRCGKSLTMIPKIWEDGMFSWEGQFWKVPPRDVRPKPYQKPHPRMWVAALQPATYQLAAEKGIGVMALSVAAPSYLEPHIRAYKERVRHANPVGSRQDHGCPHEASATRRQGVALAIGEIAPDLLRSGSPVPEGLTHLDESSSTRVARAEHLRRTSALSQDGRATGAEVDLSVLRQISTALWNQSTGYARRPRRPRGRNRACLEHRHTAAASRAAFLWRPRRCPTQGDVVLGCSAGTSSRSREDAARCSPDRTLVNRR